MGNIEAVTEFMGRGILESLEKEHDIDMEFLRKADCNADYIEAMLLKKGLS